MRRLLFLVCFVLIPTLPLVACAEDGKGETTSTPTFPAELISSSPGEEDTLSVLASQNRQTLVVMVWPNQSRKETNWEYWDAAVILLQAREWEQEGKSFVIAEKNGKTYQIPYSFSISPKAANVVPTTNITPTAAEPSPQALTRVEIKVIGQIVHYWVWGPAAIWHTTTP